MPHVVWHLLYHSPVVFKTEQTICWHSLRFLLMYNLFCGGDIMIYKKVDSLLLFPNTSRALQLNLLLAYPSLVHYQITL